MPNYTTNYNLKKPLDTENYNVEDQNGNMDIIDAQMKSIVNSIPSVPVSSVNTKTGAVVLSASDIKTTSGDTVESSLADSATDHDIIRLAKTSTGTANALLVDTAGTFDLTKNGNILHIVPNLTNTSAVTVAVDGQTVKAIKKFNVDTDAYIDIVARDLKKNTPAQLVWSVGSDFFILRPSGGGSNIKSIQRGVASVNQALNITINPVDVTKSIVLITVYSNGTWGNDHLYLGYLSSGTNLVIEKGFSNTTGDIAWQVIEFNNVKSMQRGTFTDVGGFGAITTTKTITSVDLSKSMVIGYIKKDVGSGSNAGETGFNITLTNSTTITVKTSNGGGSFIGTYYYYVIEFN